MSDTAVELAERYARLADELDALPYVVSTETAALLRDSAATLRSAPKAFAGATPETREAAWAKYPGPKDSRSNREVFDAGFDSGYAMGGATARAQAFMGKMGDNDTHNEGYTQGYRAGSKARWSACEQQRSNDALADELERECTLQEHFSPTRALLGHSGPMSKSISSPRPLLLTRDEACRLLGVSLSQYKAFLAESALREIEIGVRGKRLPYSEVERFISERLQNTGLKQ